jgi:UDP-N-acetylglucosamine 2-epimerase (non-hydrolysing)
VLLEENIPLAKYVVVAGTRPEIIKIAPIVRQLLKHSLDLCFVHTGQHHDYSLSRQIIEDLELPPPDVSFELQSASPAAQIGEIMARLEKPLRREVAGVTIVEGDTNSVLAAALTSVKNGTPVAHVEAGLRSYDWRMPEEHNRRMVDHISDFLFAPTSDSEKNLRDEKVFGRTYVTGNTVIDSVNEHLPIARRKSKILEQVKFSDFVLLTLHRAENVDDPRVLGNIIGAIIDAKIQTVFPLHPRTKARLVEYGLFSKLSRLKHVQIMEPQGYLDFLIMMKNSRFIMTDSGGIQEECTSQLMSKKTLLLRSSTERPEAVKAGAVRLIKLEREDIGREMFSEWTNCQPFSVFFSPYGDGAASERIVTLLRDSASLGMTSRSNGIAQA